jgi:hypothetical protein
MTIEALRVAAPLFEFVPSGLPVLHPRQAVALIESPARRRD